MMSIFRYPAVTVVGTDVQIVRQIFIRLKSEFFLFNLAFGH